MHEKRNAYEKSQEKNKEMCQIKTDIKTLHEQIRFERRLKTGQ